MNNNPANCPPLRSCNCIALVLIWALALLLPYTSQAQTTIEYIHTDALGSPVAVTDASGSIIEREVYEPYGSSITRPPSDQPSFTGHVADSLTGLTYMQQRYYDPQIGRFLSVDPVTAYSNPVGAFNRYWYANNNPYRFTDPDGRQAAERAYGASATSLMTPEQRRIWEGGERAATTEGSRSIEGAAMMDAMKEFVANPSVTKQSLATLATVVVLAKITRGKNISTGGGAKASNLSGNDLRRIQNAANRSGETITVVGSRAAGTARANSDWDYVVDANSKTRNNLSRSLPGAGNMQEAQRPNIDVFRGDVDRSRPYIEIKPER